MADKPNFPVDIIKDTWVKVATGVVSGFLWNKKTTSRYLQTYRATGSVDIPTDPAEGAAMFITNRLVEEINSSSPIDVYVYCIGKDGVLRVDV